MSVKKGFIYVLTHPSDPYLIKVGMTTRTPEERLREHNTRLDKAAGMVVEATGQDWVIKEYFPVEDTYNAESAFFQRSPLTEIPFRFGSELIKLDDVCMNWNWVEQGLEAARAAGVRQDCSQPPKPSPRPKRGGQWILSQLKGSGLTPLKGPGNGIMNVGWKCLKGHRFRLDGYTLARLPYCPHCEPDKFDTYTHQKIRSLDSSTE